MSQNFPVMRTLSVKNFIKWKYRNMKKTKIAQPDIIVRFKKTAFLSR